MASKREQRQQAKRKKQKVRRSEAQAQRARKTKRTRAGVDTAASWPVVEAWISQGWHRWEVTVHGVLVRGHADGTRAYAAFEVDLAEGGLVSVASGSGVSSGNVQAVLMERSSEDDPLVGTDPAFVARLAHDGLAFARDAGRSDPKGLDDALALLGDLDPDESPFDLQFGHEDEEEDTVEQPGGVWAAVKGWFGG